MKLLVKRILLFMIILAAGIALIEISARQMYLPHSDMFLKFRSFDKVSHHTQLLFIGHSHLEKCIDPSSFSVPAFNLAYSAQDMYYNQHVLSKIAKSIDEVKTLVIGLDYFSFGYDQSQTSMYYVKDYFILKGIIPAHGFPYSFFLNSSVFWLNRGKFFKDILHIPWQKKEFAFLDSYETPDYPQDTQIMMASGYRYSQGNMSRYELQNYAFETAKRNLSLYNADLEGKYQERLKIMINDFLSAGNSKRQVILLFAPLYQEYDRLIPDKLKQQSLELIKEVAHADQRILFFDCTKLYPDQDSLFLNADHLNVQGAKLFSQYLDSVLIRKVEISPHN